MSINGRASMKEWIDQADVAELLVMRSVEEVQKFVDQAAKIAGARHVGDPGTTTPGPAA